MWGIQRLTNGWFLTSSKKATVFRIPEDLDEFYERVGVNKKRTVTKKVVIFKRLVDNLKILILYINPKYRFLLRQGLGLDTVE